ncbi:hypothetical protein MHBO_004395 [Bonamia ostreae]|uniref:Uncharacterized protein n=1 Tax=Bonamia ostreae TaxID=126728 RepID=A0ABV2AU16_9EUKA
MFPIILGVSKPVYSKAELKQRHAVANQVKTYKVGDKEYKTTGYDSTQTQRRYETTLRRLKDERDALKSAGDTLGAKQLQQRITEKSKEYRNVSEQLGLKPKPNRTR